uniref:Uncharacterized protein n=1 Tax=Anguilla anguilla TaxID=7936 RepID=A0A0E9XVT0_ANGAN
MWSQVLAVRRLLYVQ